MTESKVIGIASDHAGFSFKAKMIAFLESLGFEVIDFGTTSTDSCDYPDYVHPLAKAVHQNEIPQGVLVCGSGNGVAMTANKYARVRAALAWTVEIAALARQHNDANVLCLPERFIDEALAQKLVQTFVSTDFEGGRHRRRVAKIPIK